MPNQQCTGSAVYTASDVLLHHYKKCITTYVAAKTKLLFCKFIYPSHANWHAASALIFSGTDAWV